MALKSGKSVDADTTVKLDEAFELLSKFLEGQDWLAGSNITIADFAVVVSVSFAEVNIDLSLQKFGLVKLNFNII
jgi:glutathione S-transferase